MALGTRVFKIRSVSHFAMFLSLACLWLFGSCIVFILLFDYFSSTIIDND